MISTKIQSFDNQERAIARHRELIGILISKFLPRWGHGAKPIVVRGFREISARGYREHLLRLGILFGDRSALPDVVAYSEQKNWIFLIEAVHSSGPITPIRLLELQRLAKGCTADIIFVTAFLTRDTFRKFAPGIAWETEVWIADAPDHLVHFDGDKFLGPYKSRSV
jgi:type II restriction enzyme